MRKLLFKTLNSGNTSAASFTSDSVNLFGAVGFSVMVSQVPVSGFAQATASLQVSIDNVTWITMDDSTTTIVGTDSLLIEYKDPFFEYVRVYYVPDAGTVTLNVSLVAFTNR